MIPSEQFFEKILTMFLLQVVEVIICISNPDVAEINNTADALALRIEQNMTPLKVAVD